MLYGLFIALCVLFVILLITFIVLACKRKLTKGKVLIWIFLIFLPIIVAGVFLAPYALFQLIIEGVVNAN